MNRFLNWMLTRADAHLSDEQIIADIESVAASDLPAAARHLRSCWQCLARREQLQRITFHLVEYQQALLTPFLPPPPNAEERFLRALDRAPATTRSGSADARVLRLWLQPVSHRGAIFATVAVLCIAAGLGVATRRARVSPPMSAMDFLRHAAASDPGLGRVKIGVVNQRIRIQASGQTVERTLYRDLQGRRHPRAPKPQTAAGVLHTELAHAGVDWDDPLSAASFANWHDHSAIRSDEVAQAGEGLLKLTTIATNSEVTEESLTVRQSDFHPIARTLQLRDAGTIEIAELDYSVSGWNSANDAAFDPINPGRPIHTGIVVPSVPNAEALDEAELQARLAIGQDAGNFAEALHFTRTANAIQIQGAVGTSQRKRELVARLRTIPHVSTNLFSIEELSANHTTEATEAVNSGGEPFARGTSPLTAWFQRQSRSVKEADAASRQVLVAMFTVREESATIVDLQGRFASANHLTGAAQEAFAQLLAEHLQRLDSALNEEEALVRPLLIGSSSSNDTTPAANAAGQSKLTSASERNRILCEELVSAAASRPAQSIAMDILGSVEEIRQSAIGSGSPATHDSSEQE